MSNPVIRVEGLGKKYLIRHAQKEGYVALRDVMANKFKMLGQRVLHPITRRDRSSNPKKEE